MREWQSAANGSCPWSSLELVDFQEGSLKGEVKGRAVMEKQSELRSGPNTMFSLTKTICEPPHTLPIDCAWNHLLVLLITTLTAAPCTECSLALYVLPVQVSPTDVDVCEAT